MKKKIVAFLLAGSLAFGCVGCGNQGVFDTTYTFHSVQIKMMDGTVVEGKVEKWNDYADSDVVQIYINGKGYYTHMSNVVLMTK